MAASRWNRSPPPGFTLIELMIVVAVIGILAMVAIPKFADLIRKSNEGASKGNLGAIRSAISIYYGDMEGIFPDDLSAMTNGGKYMAALPIAKAPGYHADTAGIRTLHGGCAAVAMDVNDWKTNNGYTYCAVPGDSLYGSILINCTHTDSKGILWSTY